MAWNVIICQHIIPLALVHSQHICSYAFQTDACCHKCMSQQPVPVGFTNTKALPQICKHTSVSSLSRSPEQRCQAVNHVTPTNGKTYITHWLLNHGGSGSEHPEATAWVAGPACLPQPTH
jgi:UDP-N-acetylmuramyl tripeptide synthase